MPLLLLLATAVAGAAPRFRDASGNEHTLKELRGHVSVVNIWATWCGPCREELPMLSHLAQERTAVQFVAISADEDHNKVLKLMASNEAKDWHGLTIWMGADRDLLDEWKLGETVPATMILDADGHVVCRILGEARADEIRSVLDWITGGKTAPAPATVFHHESGGK